MDGHPVNDKDIMAQVLRAEGYSDGFKDGFNSGYKSAVGYFVKKLKESSNGNTVDNDRNS